MNRPILDILSHIHKQHLDLIHSPSQHIRKQHQANRLHALAKIFSRPSANVPVLAVLWPRVHRPLEVSLYDVDKARVDELLPVVLARIQRAAELLRGFDQESVPLQQCRVFGEGVVVGYQGVERVEEFDVAARVEVPLL
jgi:hypothetical protein